MHSLTRSLHQIGAGAVVFLLAACGNSSLTPPTDTDSPTASPHSIHPMRWRFADPADRSETDAKQQTLEKIDQFWQRFQQDAPKLANDITSGNTDEIAPWMAANLRAIDKNFAWEMGPAGKDSYSLAITPETKPELRPLVATMLERAPKIPNWTFSGFREALPSKMLESGFQGRRQRPVPHFNAQLTPGAGNFIGITMSAPSFTGNDSQTDLEDAFLICELVLGEENLEKWIGDIHTKQSPGAPGDPADAVQDATELSAQFNRQKRVILDKLQQQPYYATKPPEARTLFRVGEDSKEPPRRLTFVSVALCAGPGQSARNPPDLPRERPPTIGLRSKTTKFCQF